MPLTPAIRPVSAINITADKPISAADCRRNRCEGGHGHVLDLLFTAAATA
jgi:hypothetical protein